MDDKKLKSPVWENVKGKIKLRLINREQNKDYLKEHVYKEYLDLAAVFMIQAAVYKDGKMVIPVTEKMAGGWGITVRELWETAIGNLKDEDCTIKDIRYYIPECVDRNDKGFRMYVCSMKDKSCGAEAVLREGMLKRFASGHEGKIYILPSSAYEMILVVDDRNIEVQVLKRIVEEINGGWKKEAPKDWLSDSVYYYDRENDEIRIAA